MRGHSLKVLARLGIVATAVPATMTAGFAQLNPNINYNIANSANSPIIRKFVDSLPGLGPSGANNLGSYIPIATKIANPLFPNDDYYEIGISDYFQKLHSDLPPTRLRGYKDLAPSVAANAQMYLGPIIIAKRDVPVRIKFTNNLPTSDNPASRLFVPVDTTYMGAGAGPDINPGTGLPYQYSENRADIHMHGGLPPWISDGTPHQWFVPAGDPTHYQTGASFHNVPDMADPGAGSTTMYYPNQQSSRMMWYHDHTYGLTRLNVYVGEAGGYLLYDDAELALIQNGTLPNNGGGAYTLGIPLVIQDKTFVNDAIGTSEDAFNPNAGDTDPSWDRSKWGGTGNLWFPHVYMVNQDPTRDDGANPMGRWDYGPWFWPVFPVQAPLPALSGVPEAFMDTPVVNGTPYPYMDVQPTGYRFRVLNACNDRFLNLSLFVADPANPTEMQMVDAIKYKRDPSWPTDWPADGRDGGVPDWNSAGPSWIHLGAECGFNRKSTVIPPHPVGFNYNRRDIVVLNVQERGLWLGPAERADVIVDFSAFPGKNVILYNDSPAPVPAFDARFDYYTDDSDLTDTGGAPPTQAGYGPNTRTIMQFRVADATPAPFDTTNLDSALTNYFDTQEDKPVVPEVWNGGTANNYLRISDYYITYTPYGSATPVTKAVSNKTIQELFTTDYGRMNATLGYEIPFTNATIQTTIPQGYVDPITDEIAAGEEQIWKITHNGVDTHAIHFHLVNVQIVNRVGWDGAIRPPTEDELGFKETVKMHPLEDCIVAMRANMPQRLPFGVPDSQRLMDVTTPAGSTANFTVVGGVPQVVNAVANFGWEFIWHCHLLGHEENDMMRPFAERYPDQTLPTSPNTLSAVSTSGPAAVTLSWNDRSNNEWSFRVERAPVVGENVGTFGLLTTLDPNTTTYVDQQVAADSTYAYRVEAVNKAGISAASNLAYGTTMAPPAAPSDLASTTSTAPPLSIGLTWTNNAASATAVVLQKSSASDFSSGVTTVNLGPAIATYTDTSVVAAHTYYYRVMAQYTAGLITLNSAASNIVTVTTPTAPSAATVSATSSIDVSPVQVDVSWVPAGADAASYLVRRSISSQFTNPTTLATVTAPTTTYTDTAVSQNTTYYYRVTAINGAGQAVSSSASVTSAGVPSPNAPSGTSVTADLTGTAVNVTIRWNDNSTNETGFKITRATNSTFTTGVTVVTTTAAYTGTGARSYVDTSVAANTAYYYRVSGIRGAFEGPYGSTSGPVTTLAIPSAVTSVAAAQKVSAPKGITITWRDNSTNETGFKILRTTANTVAAWNSATLVTTVAAISGTGTSGRTYTDTTTTTGVTYYYRVVPTNAAGDGGYGNTTTAIVAP